MIPPTKSEVISLLILSFPKTKPNARSRTNETKAELRANLSINGDFIGLFMESSTLFRAMNFAAFTSSFLTGVGNSGLSSCMYIIPDLVVIGFDTPAETIT